MPAFTHGVTESLLSIQQIDQASARANQQLSTGKQVSSPQDDSGIWLEADRAQSTGTYLDAIHAGLNELATSIHVADTTMTAIGNNLTFAKQQLVQTSLYPAGDPTRDQLIRNYNLALQQIDDLAHTNSDMGARKLLSDPALYPQAGDIRALVGPNGAAATVHARVADTGPNGLNLAPLDIAATDADIQAAVAQLTASQSVLRDRQAGLGLDAKNVQRNDDRNTQLTTLVRSHAETIEASDANTAAAELLSAQTQRSLALSVLAGITSMRKDLLGLLG